ncbi:MAG TPA: hypothetical protein PLR22_04035 [Saprospiraceae bacterium]|nr:hypothetical protein [Saprospiraceae bacterium]
MNDQEYFPLMGINAAAVGDIGSLADLMKQLSEGHSIGMESGDMSE